MSTEMFGFAPFKPLDLGVLWLHQPIAAAVQNQRPFQVLGITDWEGGRIHVVSYSSPEILLHCYL